MRRFWLRVFSFFRSSAADRELARELRAHLQLLEDDFVGKGMSVEEARFAARRAFGGQVEQTRLRQRDARAFRWMTESWLDVKLGARMLVKYPGLTLVGGLGMAVAIAISTASFAFFYSSLQATLPLDDGDRIVALENWDVERNNEARRAAHDYLLWREELRSFEEIGAFRVVNRNVVVPGGAAEPAHVAEVTASTFRIARVPPLFGRPLLDDDERVGAPPVVVIGYDVWHSRFDAAPDVVGRTLRLGNVVHTIVGVMPDAFKLPVNDSYWTPLRLDTSRFARGEGPSIFIFGRLTDGVSMEDANAELAAVGLRSATAFPETHGHLRPQVMPYSRPILDIQDVAAWQVAMMQLTVSTLLLVVALNVAILVYARTATRQGEIAVRTALGASRPRIIGQLFIESLLLAAIASAAGLALARFGLAQAHRIMALDLARAPYWIDYDVPWAAVLYVAALCIFVALVAGAVPALQATSKRVQSTLRELSGSTGMRLGRTWTMLIVAQVAFAVAAMPLALGMAWQEIRNEVTRPTFAAERYLAAAFAMDSEPPHGVDPAAYRRGLNARSAELQTELVTRLEAEPWVGDVTLALRPPGQEASRRIEIEQAAAAAPGAFTVSTNQVDVDFFDAVEAPALIGRTFTEADRGHNVVIVNRAFAQRILGGADVLGRRIRYPATVDDDDGPQTESPWHEIVGVAADLHANALNPELVTPAVYHPLTFGGTANGSVLVRVAGGAPDPYIGRLRELAAAIDPGVRVNAYPLVEIYRQANVALRLVAAALGLAILSVLLLSAAGIYALMSFTVSQRRKEIGIRAALGADATRLLGSIFARAARQLLLGVSVGVAVAWIADIGSGGELMGPERTVLVPSMAMVMVVVGLLAAVGPATRGLRLEPTQALRDE